MNVVQFINEHIFHLLIFGYWAVVFLCMLFIITVGKYAESDLDLDLL